MQLVGFTARSRIGSDAHRAFSIVAEISAEVRRQFATADHPATPTRFRLAQSYLLCAKQHGAFMLD
ncbi:MAG: hypothetical protein AUI16_07395 [Alphaproteobacteria bacterium 13_2_20CM_2_64_7]|nr:MAG: hypothetical protein AUI16_07395 [Alphaproteobacteria bacterium 13_2_20CM_2_64_7]